MGQILTTSYNSIHHRIVVGEMNNACRTLSIMPVTKVLNIHKS